MLDKYQHGWCSEYDGLGCLRGCTGIECARGIRAKRYGVHFPLENPPAPPRKCSEAPMVNACIVLGED